MISFHAAFSDLLYKNYHKQPKKKTKKNEFKRKTNYESTNVYLAIASPPAL